MKNKNGEKKNETTNPTTSAKADEKKAPVERKNTPGMTVEEKNIMVVVVRQMDQAASAEAAAVEVMAQVKDPSPKFKHLKLKLEKRVHAIRNQVKWLDPSKKNILVRERKVKKVVELQLKVALMKQDLGQALSSEEELLIANDNTKKASK